MDQEGPQASSLREPVLAGRYFAHSPFARELAEWLTLEDTRALLASWFGEAWLGWLASQSAAASVLRAALDRDIAAIDALLSVQLDAVAHHARVRRLEGSWRGLAWLVDRLPPAGGRVRLKVLSARWGEICRDLERALEFDQSHLFRKIYEEEFGMPGGEPYGLIIADYEVQHRPSGDHPTDDVAALRQLAGLAAAAFAPTILGASPELFGLDSFAEVPASLDLSLSFPGSDYARWRSLASQEDARFLSVALPHVLARPPWADNGSRADGFRFRTYTPGADQRVWTSAVYGFAAVAIRAFDRFSWPAEVRGADISDEARGGILDDLPTERFASDLANEAPPRAPLDLLLTDDQESQVAQVGLVALCALEGLPEAAFAALPALYRPPRMTSTIADANQRISSQLNSLLCVSRFAHCIKLMGRDMTGSFADPVDVQIRLQKWLESYVSGSVVGQNDAARYPLLDAKVEVRERTGFPGQYSCTVHLMPHHQLDEIGATFRFVTQFESRNKAA